MGARGPQPTPTRILDMRGSWRAKRRKNEPRPELGRPICPAWLPLEAKRAWRRLIPMVEAMGILAKIDGNALARYCVAWMRWREMDYFVQEHGVSYPVSDGGKVSFRPFPQVRIAAELADQLSRLEQSFGLTPAARARLNCGDYDADVNQDHPARKYLA